MRDICVNMNLFVELKPIIKTWQHMKSRNSWHVVAVWSSKAFQEFKYIPFTPYIAMLWWNIATLVMLNSKKNLNLTAYIYSNRLLQKKILLSNLRNTKKAFVATEIFYMEQILFMLKCNKDTIYAQGFFFKCLSFSEYCRGKTKILFLEYKIGLSTNKAVNNKLIVRIFVFSLEQ